MFGKSKGRHGVFMRLLFTKQRAQLHIYLNMPLKTSLAVITGGVAGGALLALGTLSQNVNLKSVWHLIEVVRSYVVSLS